MGATAAARTAVGVAAAFGVVPEWTLARASAPAAVSPYRHRADAVTPPGSDAGRARPAAGRVGPGVRAAAHARRGRVLRPDAVQRRLRGLRADRRERAGRQRPRD